MDAARVYVGSDHAGFSLRRNLTERLRGQGREVVDLGPESDAACDYPEFASAVANAVRADPGALGILVCATGQGMAIAAGKVRGIRAVVPATVEAARLTRFDNNANVLCLGSRLMSERDAFDIIDTWLSTGFAGGRHARRIAKVAAIETASAMMFVTESEWLRLRELRIPERIWEDAGELATAPSTLHQNGSTWVALPGAMTPRLPELASFAREVRHRPLKDLVLLVEDAAHAPAAVMARLCGTSSVQVHVVDAATGDAKQLAVPDRPGTTFVLAVSRREGDGERLSRCEAELWARLLQRCDGREEQAGSHFAAIAAADDRLAAIARSHHYQTLFVAEPTTPCFGLLGYEGLVPAALLGQDPARLLERASAMAESCRTPRLEDNPGVSLGVLLGALAKHGRNKLTLLLSRSLQALGPWIAQLLTATSKSSTLDIVTAHGEQVQSRYPPDRVFVHMQTEGEPPAVAPEQMEALHGAGQPYIHIVLANRQDLAAEIYRWQVAATVVGVVIAGKPRLLLAG